MTNTVAPKDAGRKNSLARKAVVGTTVSRIFVYIAMILISLLCIFPFYILVVNSTRSHQQIMHNFSLIPSTHLVDNFKSLFTKDRNMPIIQALGNSLLISTCCAALTTYFSAMTAYAIHAYEFRFKKFLFGFILFIMMVPTQISVLGFIQLVTKMDMMDTYWPLIIPSVAAPAVFWYMKQYMESVLPLEIIEAARVDGSGEFRTFNQIVLPVIKPAMAVQAIFSFVSTWNNYFVPALLINSNDKKTVPIVIALLRGADYAKFDYGLVYMMILIAIIPLLIMYLILSKYIIRGITLGSVKG